MSPALAHADGGGQGHSGLTRAEAAVERDDGLIVVPLTDRPHPWLPAASAEPTWRAAGKGLGKALSRVG
ncbi:hypothetical protein [Halostreptopolyspora alba]|uniref:hypothetical protein n=1 Tax=Halostreptopolyspora alba TaxID=2487137 RepID=UPI0011CDE767